MTSREKGKEDVVWDIVLQALSVAFTLTVVHG